MNFILSRCLASGLVSWIRRWTKSGYDLHCNLHSHSNALAREEYGLKTTIGIYNALFLMATGKQKLSFG